jgi:hypothetical protein
MQDAILSMTGKPLFYKTTIRPVPKDYQIPLIEMYTTRRYFYKIETNLE